MKHLFSVFQSKYFYLLVSLICYFIGTPFLVHKQISNFIISTLLSIFIVLCINLISAKRFLLYSSIALGIIALMTYWIMSYSGMSERLAFIHYSTILVFLVIMTYYVISAVAEQKHITTDSLLGAICGYFMLGLLWSQIYLLIDAVNPYAFSNHYIATSIRDHVQHFIYYSFQTITTLGFGDILPASDVARTFSWLEAVTGQIYLAVWISQLVGLRIAQAVNGKN
jgi:hypothetical protein